MTCSHAALWCSLWAFYMKAAESDGAWVEERQPNRVCFSLKMKGAGAFNGLSHLCMLSVCMRVPVWVCAMHMSMCLCCTVWTCACMCECVQIQWLCFKPVLRQAGPLIVYPRGPVSTSCNTLLLLLRKHQRFQWTALQLHFAPTRSSPNAAQY